MYHRITQHSAQNNMTAQNLSIVFGPTLFGQLAPGMPGEPQTNGAGIADAMHQNKVRVFALYTFFSPYGVNADALILCACVHALSDQAVETILDHYNDIFVDENEEAS